MRVGICTHNTRLEVSSTQIRVVVVFLFFMGWGEGVAIIMEQKCFSKQGALSL